MKAKLLATLSVFGLFSLANAHDFWVKPSYDENLVKINFGYGHEFPNMSEIKEERQALFEDPFLFKDNTKFVLSKKKGSHTFVGNLLENGTYIVAGNYKPTTWSKTKDGKWHMHKNKSELENVESCMVAQMSAKAILNINANENVKAEVGQKLEIIPMQNPSQYKVGEPFKVQILFDKKPLPLAKVGAIFGELEDGQMAFWGFTDKQGKINIKLFKSGEYALKVKHEVENLDKTLCDKEEYLSTFYFNVQE